MPTTIEAGFNQLLSRVRTTPAETAAAKGHRASIEEALQRSFGITSFFRTGSFGNGTNVAGHSDVDFFAVIPPERLKQDSSASLRDVAQALRDRFPNTGVRLDTPAARVPFGFDGSETTDVVPVDETGQTLLGYRQFDMPDGQGGWMFTAPDTHDTYVRDVDLVLDGRVKPLIRFLKAWKFYNGVPIGSFYLEIRVAEYARIMSHIFYDLDLANVFTRLLNDGLYPYPDPRVRDQFLIPCKTEIARGDAMAKLERALRWAAQAVNFENVGNTEAAFGRWRLVFNGRFPPFG